MSRTDFTGNILRQGQSWLRKLKNNSFLRKAAVLSGGTAAGHIFTLAVSPLLTRIYRPEDFGSLGLFTSFLSTAGVGVALQYETSILAAANESEASYLALGSAILGIPTSVIAGLAMWFLIQYSLLGFGRLAWYVPIALSCVMCFLGYFAVLRYWSLRNQEFREVSQSLVVQSAARAVLQTGAGLLGFHEAGLIFGETLGRGVGMGRMFKSAWPELRSQLSGFRWHEFQRVLGKNWKFPVLSFPSALIDAVCISMSVPLLIQQFGPYNGGCYSLVWRALALPSTLISMAVADTFHSQLAACVRESPAEAPKMFLRTSGTLLLVGAVPAAILYVWAEPLFILAFGSQWRIAGAMAALIAPWYLCQFVVNPVSRTVLVLSGQETKLIWDLLCLVAIPTVFYMARIRAMDVLATVRLLSIVSALLYIAYFAVLLYLIHRFHRTMAVDAMVLADSTEAAK